jgi:hypothetical protein
MNRDTPPRLRSALILWGAVLFSAMVLWADYFAGPFIRMPVLHVLPVLVASWYGGILAGECFALGLPLAHFALEASVAKPWSWQDSLWNAAILMFAFGLIAYLVAHVQQQRKRLRILQGLLPICSFCKKIRTSEQEWEHLESYISRHSQAQFSHGLCPTCARREYGVEQDAGT